MESLCVLLVEDDKAHLELMQRSFAGADLVVSLHTARTIYDARRIVPQCDPGVLVTDYLLPDGTGIDLAREYGSRMPVIMLTGFGDEEVARSALLAGALDYIPKSAHSLSQMPELVRKARLSWAQRESESKRLLHLSKMEAMGRLTRGLAHDFNNLLASVQVNADLGQSALADGDPAVTAKALREIAEATVRATDLVRQLQAFSRSEPGHESSCDVAETLRDARSFLESAARGASKQHFKISSGVPRARLSPTRLREALVNLVLNAVDAEPSSVWISASREALTEPKTCSSCREAYGGTWVRIAVRDDGSGIPKDVRPNIFDPFFTTKDVSRHSGMGLSVVEGYAHQAGGHLVVDSGESGTEVALYFPVAASQRDPGGPSAAEDRAECGRILFVDDERLLVSVVTSLVRTAGHSIEAFDDPLKALDKFKANPQAYDLVITDLTMPKLSGTALSKELRALRPELPIILYSGFSDIVTDDEAQYYSRILSKPFAPAELLDLIAELLDKPG